MMMRLYSGQGACAGSGSYYGLGASNPFAGYTSSYQNNGYHGGGAYGGNQVLRNGGYLGRDQFFRSHGGGHCGRGNQGGFGCGGGPFQQRLGFQQPGWNGNGQGWRYTNFNTYMNGIWNNINSLWSGGGGACGGNTYGNLGYGGGFGGGFGTII
jgi:hypothetical protein